jgi:hypothetical protein
MTFYVYIKLDLKEFCGERFKRIDNPHNKAWSHRGCSANDTCG